MSERSPAGPESGPGIVWFLRRCGALLRPSRREAALVAAAILLRMSYSVAVALAFKFLVDTAILTGDGGRLVAILGALAVAFVVAAAADLGQDRLIASIVGKLLLRLRLAMLEHLQRMPLAFYGRISGGALATHFSADLSSLELGVGRALPKLFGGALRVVISVVVLFVLDWRLALVTFAVFPLGVIGPRLLGSRATAASEARKLAEGDLLAALQEEIAAQPVIKAFRLQSARMAAHAAVLARLEERSVRADVLARLVGRTTDVGQTLMQLVIVVVGASLAYSGTTSVGSLVAFFGVLLGMGNALQAVSEVLPDLVQAIGGLARLDRLLAHEVRTGDAADAVALPSCAREIRFDDVVHAPDGSHPVLDRVSCTIPIGRSTALVGRSGSGKSTLLGLILRFDDPTSGAVTIDGFDLRGLKQDSVRACFGALFQEPLLLDATIRENVRMGKPGATDEEIEAAARAAEVHDAILRLPHGYDTAVGERGRNLSGGQRQRIALARAIVGRPPVLLLDEATSALDPEAEAAIHETLDRLARTHTVISATHRLTTVRHFDRIVVLDQGRVAEQGTHDELVARGGIYARLWQQQSGFAISDDGAEAVITTERLQRIPVFSAVDPATLASLAESFVAVRKDAGELVFEQGERGDAFYVVARGRLEVVRRDPTGGDVPIATLEDGDFFGEMALLEGVPRSAAVVARASSTLLALSRERFLELSEAAPEFRRTVERISVQRKDANLRGATLGR